MYSLSFIYSGRSLNFTSLLSNLLPSFFPFPSNPTRPIISLVLPRPPLLLVGFWSSKLSSSPHTSPARMQAQRTDRRASRDSPILHEQMLTGEAGAEFPRRRGRKSRDRLAAGEYTTLGPLSDGELVWRPYIHSYTWLVTFGESMSGPVNRVGTRFGRNISWRVELARSHWVPFFSPRWCRMHVNVMYSYGHCSSSVQRLGFIYLLFFISCGNSFKIWETDRDVRNAKGKMVSRNRRKRILFFTFWPMMTFRINIPTLPGFIMQQFCRCFRTKFSAHSRVRFDITLGWRIGLNAIMIAGKIRDNEGWRGPGLLERSALSLSWI